MTLRIDKELFQWEKNRYVYIDSVEGDPKISSIQFYNKKSKYAPEVPVESDKAQIPNFLLKEALPIVAVACIESDNNGTQVITRRVFKVLARTKPEFYFDDEDTGIEVIYDGGEEI